MRQRRLELAAVLAEPVVVAVDDDVELRPSRRTD